MLVPVREAISSRQTAAVYIFIVLSAVLIFAVACTVSLFLSDSSTQGKSPMEKRRAIEVSGNG
jgi:hypothetical protein